MSSAGSRFEYFSALHHDFSELYPSVNQHVINLYARPRKFILETGPVIDGFLRSYAVPGEPKSKDVHARNMLQFISEVDQFTGDTMSLFELHKQHVEQCSEYMEVVSVLDTRQIDFHDKRSIDLYVELTPKLIELHNGLRHLKDRAEKMAAHLNELEKRWQALRGNPTL